MLHRSGLPSPCRPWVLLLSVFLCAGLGAAPALAGPMLGWTVGDAGTLLHTEDGGATWTAQTSGTTQNLRGVAFTDALDGWAVGNAGTILHTTNGGTIWTPQTSGTLHDLQGVSFADALHGWAVGTFNTLLHTSDGGNTWTSVFSNLAVQEGSTAVASPDASNAWITSAFHIQHTGDGGNTWTNQYTSGLTNIDAIAFPNISDGWAVTNGFDDFVLHTSDGGASWAEQNHGGGGIPLHGIAFADASNGWAVGRLGAITHTTNGGSTWSARTPVSGITFLNGVATLDAADAWSVGTGGTIIHTSDGNTWARQTSGTTQALNSVAFVLGPDISAVPEPKSALLLSMGLPLLLVAIRRRRLVKC